MELKTIVKAEEGKQEITITRDFEIPLQSLFRAFVEPAIIEHWMSTKVVKFEHKNHGGYVFETSDPSGQIHRFNGVFHHMISNQSIIRTFEMEQSPFPPQLEFLEFKEISDSKSKLIMQVIYKSVTVRDELLKLPFAQGINMAHTRLENYFHSKK